MLAQDPHAPVVVARSYGGWLFTLLPDALSQFFDRTLDFVQEVELDVAVPDLPDGVFDVADRHAAEEGFAYGGRREHALLGIILAATAAVRRQRVISFQILMEIVSLLDTT